MIDDENKGVLGSAATEFCHTWFVMDKHIASMAS